ncbi:MAG: hypothetical protein IPO86_10010 [Saprospiraceae bacterium]|nr:hypothetical protein [Saprospiraceae bacterium]
MVIQNFITKDKDPKVAMNQINEQLIDFFKYREAINTISISHSLHQNNSDAYVASVLICYNGS